MSRSLARWSWLFLMLGASGCGGSGEGNVEVATAEPAAKDESPQPDRVQEPLAPVSPPSSTTIPQDPAKNEARRQDRLAWQLATTLGAYDKVGQTDPRWDKPARSALNRMARVFAQAADPLADPVAAHREAEEAIQAGCEDPLVTYIWLRTSQSPADASPDQAELAQRLRNVVEGLTTRGYPAVRRANALGLAAEAQLAAGLRDEETRAAIQRDLDALLAIVREPAAGEGLTPFAEENWLEKFLAQIRVDRALGSPATEAYERVDAALADLPPWRLVRALLRGQFWLNYGWEARTIAFAPDVPAGGFELLEQRLAVAREAFEAAWALRPDDPRAATAMIDIEKAIGGDREAMELWFDRAIRANGNSQAACLTKLDWLDPKWHGTPEELLDFGRACRDTRNVSSGIPLLLADAHLRFASMMPFEQERRYFGDPTFWADVQDVYEAHLKVRPEDDVARSKYAALAYQCGWLRNAHAQFLILGDRLSSWSSIPYYPLQTLKAMRSETYRVFGGQHTWTPDTPAP